MPSVSLANASSKNGYYVKAGSANADLSLKPVNVGAPKGLGGGVSATGIEAGNNKGTAQWNVKKGHVEAEARVGAKQVAIGGEATFVKYEGSVNFKVFGKEVSIGGTAALGTVGARVSAGTNGVKTYVGAGAVGLGFSIDIKK